MKDDEGVHYRVRAIGDRLRFGDPEQIDLVRLDKVHTAVYEIVGPNDDMPEWVRKTMSALGLECRACGGFGEYPCRCCNDGHMVCDDCGGTSYQDTRAMSLAQLEGLLAALEAGGLEPPVHAADPVGEQLSWL